MLPAKGFKAEGKPEPAAKTNSGKSEVGVQAWVKTREEWLKVLNSKKCITFQVDPQNKKKPFAKSRPVSDSYRTEVYEIIKAVRPPYPAFKHNISLEEMVDVLLEVWEDDEDF